MLLQMLLRLKLSRLIGLIVVLFFGMVFVCHYVLTHSEDHKIQTRFPSSDAVRKMLSILDPEDDKVNGIELKKRINELLRIKDSVLKELRDLEQQRSEKIRQVSDLDDKLKELKEEATKEKFELDGLKVKVEQAKFALKELAERNTPELIPPLRLKPNIKDNYVANDDFREASKCDFGQCFDWTRCPISSGFPVYFYNNMYGWTSTKRGFGYLTNSSEEACLFVGSANQQLPDLHSWKGNGRNHLILDVNIAYYPNETSSNEFKVYDYKNSGKSMIVSWKYFDKVKPRLNFDVIVPPVKYFEVSSDLWKRLGSLVPIRRKYLMSYQEPYLSENKAVRDLIEEPLNLINDDKTSDKVVVDFHCKPGSEAGFCGTFERRSDLLRKSIFTLILSTSKLSDVSQRITEALETSTVPVFICMPSCANFKHHLPLAEVIDWSKAAIFLPVARITEIHFILRSFVDSDLFMLKKQGRDLWQNYLGSGPALMSAVINLVRTRVGLPAAPFDEEPATEIFNDDFQRLYMESINPENLEPREALGPLEPPTPSPSFRRNHSFWINGHEVWNDNFVQASRLPPYDPFEPLLPTEAKFLGSSNGYRPINQGEGGSGKEFSQALGGNTPSEQFTIVILTYEREAVLMESISRLYGLPYLNKVLVVWNSEMPPAPDLHWPDIGVPVVVIKTSKNSLNNRFLPYDAIETEAVLSLDDDAHLRQDEIIVGFRVWREHRHQLVGFPARYHAWDGENFSWNYNSNYSCELSMVLTGAAFYHKYYAYAYSYIMPQAIRDKIDEYMNCEDLAMNFLISHMTRSPPVKVTSRWTFRCHGCPVTLSEDDSHFQERHKCLNFFTQVYGYTPLLYTQYRADSVLFKTRIPQDKQKCFKYV